MRVRLTYLQQPRLRISSTRCCSCLLGGLVVKGSTSSPNRSSSMLGMAAPNWPMWSSNIMGILGEVICEHKLQLKVYLALGKRGASGRWLVWSAWA